jgi:hypothetical protein
MRFLRLLEFAHAGAPEGAVVIGAALLRILGCAATLACLLGAAHLVGETAPAHPDNPLTSALDAARFFIVPLVVAWFMPGWRWLLCYVLLITFVFLGGMALSGAPGGRAIATTMFAVGVASGALAGFLAGVIGRSVGLALLHYQRAPVVVWAAQIAPAFIAAAAVQIIGSQWSMVSSQ